MLWLARLMWVMLTPWFAHAVDFLCTDGHCQLRDQVEETGGKGDRNWWDVVFLHFRIV